MLLSLTYKNNSNQQISVNLSGDNMSSAIVYCDANNFTPQIISIQNYDLIVVNPSLTSPYTVVLKDVSTNLNTSAIIYDTYSNVMSWIDSQSNKELINLNYQNKAFVQA